MEEGASSVALMAPPCGVGDSPPSRHNEDESAGGPSAATASTAPTPPSGEDGGEDKEADALAMAPLDDRASTASPRAASSTSSRTSAPEGEERAAPVELRTVRAVRRAEEGRLPRHAEEQHLQPVCPPWPAVHEHGLRLVTGAISIPSPVCWQQDAPKTMYAGEMALLSMLQGLDFHTRSLRMPQQWLVGMVEVACRQTLKDRFGRLMLVGSAALLVETPGSDFDVVCFTQSDDLEESREPSAGILFKVQQTLRALVGKQCSREAAKDVTTNLIGNARVPILSVLWGFQGSVAAVKVELSIDQLHPVGHVCWFRRALANIPCAIAQPFVNATLRFVKHWLAQRQIPRMKEGCLPTLAWLLMALHTSRLPEAFDHTNGGRLCLTLMASLSAFFRCYSELGGLDGTLRFTPGGVSSSFSQKPKERRSSWADLTVCDPTCEEGLAPPLTPATQLLLAHELRRADARLRRCTQPRRGTPPIGGEPYHDIMDVFASMPEGANSCPSDKRAFGALMLLGNPSDSEDIGVLEAVFIDRVVPRPGWAAPFLHRSDNRSELFATVLNVHERTGRSLPRPKGMVMLCPCHFVCRLDMQRVQQRGRGGPRAWTLDAEGLDRLSSMRAYLAAMQGRRRALEDKQQLAK